MGHPTAPGLAIGRGFLFSGLTMHYYNEIDDYAATWIENLILDGQLPNGVVDRRSIVDVAPADLAGFTQCHFFAGICGWPLALRLAGWPDDREVWTGSPPCQPFSHAGKQLAASDERHLWPYLFRLIRARRPDAFFGEQVAAAIGLNWLDRVFADLEGGDYACRSFVLPACAVNAPHRRDRLYFAARYTHTHTHNRTLLLDHGHDTRLEGQSGYERYPTGWTFEGRPVAEAGDGGDVGDIDFFAELERGLAAIRAEGSGEVAPERQVHAYDADRSITPADDDGFGEQVPAAREQSAVQVARCDLDTDRPWSSTTFIIGHDGKARRVEPSIRLLADGVPGRVGRLRSYGNAIVPQLAAQVIRSYMETQP